MDCRIDFKKIPWESPMEGMRQKCYRSGNRQLRVVEYSKHLPPHWCEKGHIGYVLEGKMELRFENGVQTFGPGDGIFIPAGSENRHSAAILADKVTIFFLEDV